MDNPATSIPSVPLQPNVEPTVSSSAESPAGPKNRLWLLWLLGGLTTLTLGIAVGPFSAKFLNRPQPQSQLPPTPTLPPSLSVTPAKEADPTANWKTFTTDDKKVSFKYPSDWTVDQHTTSEGWGKSITIANIKNDKFHLTLSVANA